MAASNAQRRITEAVHQSNRCNEHVVWPAAEPLCREHGVAPSRQAHLSSKQAKPLVEGWISVILWVVAELRWAPIAMMVIRITAGGAYPPAAEQRVRFAPTHRQSRYGDLGF